MDAKSVIAANSIPFRFRGFLGRKRESNLKFSGQTDLNVHALARKTKSNWKRVQSVGNAKETSVECASLVQNLHRKNELCLPDKCTLSDMMLYFAGNGHIREARAIWEEMLNSSEMPSIEIISKLFYAFAKWGYFDGVVKILDQLSYSDFSNLHEAYSIAISCFGDGGQLPLMENALNDMVLRGFTVDYATGNAFIRYCSMHGSLREMESAYSRLKKSRHLIDREGIRAISLVYLRRRKLYRLGEFLRDVGLARKDVGNLLWNFLLLSYAADFKMKTLQREFLKMLEAGFRPDVTTFNIRALAFSRMSLLWDLHLSLEHMKHERVSPDLVTYGCIVDAYLDRRLAKNLNFALKKMNMDGSPVLLTDPFVFEVLGKGDFHSSAESFLEFKRQWRWTYKELVSVYLRKQHRSNQIFWNY
ncbi:pentatricopeptide repeat-containing protein At3g42630 [Mercurialis annua]|uniref:pentatricopeptide repeat-containing protein At3g42630 n=1 Tax=Mercurialis annua TaxID=3986 RepID=UPI00215EB0A0|nr:pentatricopeptide repeat-containing protein At3g42630 [Mercurialis annua]